MYSGPQMSLLINFWPAAPAAAAGVYGAMLVVGGLGGRGVAWVSRLRALRMSNRHPVYEQAPLPIASPLPTRNLPLAIEGPTMQPNPDRDGGLRAPLVIVSQRSIDSGRHHINRRLRPQPQVATPVLQRRAETVSTQSNTVSSETPDSPSRASNPTAANASVWVLQG